MRLRMIAPIAGLVALVGCSVPSPSVAAIVGDQTITVKELDAIVIGCKSLLGEQADASLQTNLISTLVMGRAIEKVARDSGVDLSQEQIDKLISQSQLATLAEDPECRKAVEANARIAITFNQLGEQKATSLVSSMKIDLNPRYGRWDSTVPQLVSGGSISEPAEGQSEPLR